MTPEPWSDEAIAISRRAGLTMDEYCRVLSTTRMSMWFWRNGERNIRPLAKRRMVKLVETLAVAVHEGRLPLHDIEPGKKVEAVKDVLLEILKR